MASKKLAKKASDSVTVEKHHAFNIFLSFTKETANTVRYDAPVGSIFDKPLLENVYIKKEAFRSFYEQNGSFPGGIVVSVEALK